MTVPVLKQDAFLEYLKGFGFNVVETKYWDQQDRIIMEKDGVKFPFQMQEKYFYPIVVRICREFNIPAPPDHQKNYDQDVEMYKKKGSK
jgi:hypothetical protein